MLKIVFVCLCLCYCGEVVAQNQILEGTIVKKAWSKTVESYCHQGSDYYVLESPQKTWVLVGLSNVSRKIAQLEGKQVRVTGKAETKTIEKPADPMAQRPMSFTPDGKESDFTCEVFRVYKIAPK